ncbi:hypothetical protein TNCV_2979741 [Trichonephila clavipes]|nr:hypothetical protein TNCV_2979741 [Trichonephila clavipes]
MQIRSGARLPPFQRAIRNFLKAIGDSFLSMQDNARLHIPRFMENFLEAETIQRMERTVCSPDLNPIQHV